MRRYGRLIEEYVTKKYATNLIARVASKVALKDFIRENNKHCERRQTRKEFVRNMQSIYGVHNKLEIIIKQFKNSLIAVTTGNVRQPLRRICW